MPAWPVGNRLAGMSRHDQRHRFRSRPAVIALIGWWSAVVLAVLGWFLLDASLRAGDDLRMQQVGIWLIGFAALGSVVGWGASVGSIIRDTGRVRAGAICLMLLPVLGLVFGWIAISSTVLSPTDPVTALWLVLSLLLLGVATLLILLPEHLGTH